MDPRLLAGGLLGWSLGANNSANVFGTAVASQMVRWITAAVLIAVFAFLGAVLQGHEGLETYSALAGQTAGTAFYVSLATAITATVMTVAKIPVSTSQAVVGGILGIALYTGERPDLGQLKKVVICWVGTPFGAAMLSVVMYPVLAAVIRRMKLHFLTYDRVMRVLLIAAGIYGAYSLGANNTANAVGVFYEAGSFGPVGASWTKTVALAFGGVAIALGALTYSRKVIYTVGHGIIRLDAFSAFVVVLAQAATVHVYAMVGVPVSTSQAIVGAVVGIGVYKGMKTIRYMTLVKIGAGWLLTPVMGFGLAWAMMWLFG